MAPAERNRWKVFFISPPEEKKFGMLANARTARILLV
jgi:hypothetical protein